MNVLSTPAARARVTMYSVQYVSELVTCSPAASSAATTPPGVRRAVEPLEHQHRRLDRAPVVVVLAKRRSSGCPAGSSSPPSPQGLRITSTSSPWPDTEVARAAFAERAVLLLVHVADAQRQQELLAAVHPAAQPVRALVVDRARGGRRCRRSGRPTASAGRSADACRGRVRRTKACLSQHDRLRREMADGLGRVAVAGWETRAQQAARRPRASTPAELAPGRQLGEGLRAPERHSSRAASYMTARQMLPTRCAARSFARSLLSAGELDTGPSGPGG